MAVARDNLNALTGLRFVAAFSIAGGHALPASLPITAIGMPLFFTLSGFVIHYVYGQSFSGAWKPAAKEFAVARVSRIYPLYLFLLLYFFLFTPMGSKLATSRSLAVMLSYVLAFWSWWPFSIGNEPIFTWYYSISWSVSTEIFFYVCYAVLLYRLDKIRNAGNCAAALIGFCLAAYSIFYLLFLTRDRWEPLGLVHFPQFTSRTSDFNASFYRWFLYISPYSRLFEFIGGVLTCQLFLLLRRERRKIPAAALAWLALAAIGVLFAGFIYFSRNEPWVGVGNHSPAAFFVELHMNFLFAPACYLLILALAVGGNSIGEALSAKFPRFLGDISYSTYLSHQLAARALFHTGLDTTAAIPHFLMVMPVIYGVSWVLYTLLEVPAKRALRHGLQGWLLDRASVAKSA